MGSQVSTSLPTPLTRSVGREIEPSLPTASLAEARPACAQQSAGEAVSPRAAAKAWRRGIQPQPGSRT